MTNKNGKEILQKYVDTFLKNDENLSFFILSGPQGIGKSQIVQDVAKESL